MVRRVDSVMTLMSCRTTPMTTKLISPYDAMATPAVTTTCGTHLVGACPVTTHPACRAILSMHRDALHALCPVLYPRYMFLLHANIALSRE